MRNLSLYRRSWRGMKGFAHCGGIAPDHDKVGAGGGVGVFAALFPIPQRAERNTKTLREIFLAQVEGAANNLYLRGPLHALEIFGRERFSVGIVHSGSVALLLGHGVQSAPIMLGFSRLVHGIVFVHGVPHYAPI